MTRLLQIVCVIYWESPQDARAPCQSLIGVFTCCELARLSGLIWAILHALRCHHSAVGLMNSNASMMAFTNYSMAYKCTPIPKFESTCRLPWALYCQKNSWSRSVIERALVAKRIPSDPEALITRRTGQDVESDGWEITLLDLATSRLPHTSDRFYYAKDIDNLRSWSRYETIWDMGWKMEGKMEIHRKH